MNDLNKLNLTNKIILVVEDNEGNQDVLRDMLEIIDCQFDIASNGEEALKKFSEKPYDLIIMDIQMPGKDGYEVTREIRRQEKGKKHTLILAMTAYALVGDSEKCLKAGMDDYISKPIEINQLRRKLDDLFNPLGSV